MEGGRVIMLSRDDVREVRGILSQLAAAVRNSQLYSPEHPMVREFNAMLLSNLQEQTEKRGTIVIRFAEGQVIFNKTPLYELSEAAPGFAQVCLGRQIQGVTFSNGLNADELDSFIEIMAFPAGEIESRGGMQREILSRGFSHIGLERLAQPEQTAETIDDSEREQGRQTYKRALSEIKEAMEHARLNQTISNANAVKEVVSDMINSLSRKVSVLLGLTSIKNYDEYTFYHSVNVGVLSLALGMRLSLQRNQLEGLGISAILHDIGKILIPEHILRKPRELSDDEWLIVRRHPVDGARILRKTQGMPNCAPVAAFEHHIKYDLSGYPDLVRPRQLTFFSLMVSIADCYDAMTTLRPYRKPSTPADALKTMLQLSGRDFEPRLLEEFVEMIGVYPVGSLVRLDTNEFAVLYDVDPEDGERPMVKIVINAKGQRLDPGRIVALRERDPETGDYRSSIVQAVDPTSKEINVANFL